MKSWLAAYGGYVLGVLSVAGAAYWYWANYMGEEAEE